MLCLKYTRQDVRLLTWQVQDETVVLSSDDDDLDSLLDSDDEVSLLTSSVFSGKPPQGSPLKGSSGGINVVKGAHRRKKAPARRVPTFPPKQKAATMCFDVELTMFCERACPPSEDLMFFDNYVQIPVPGQPVLNVQFIDIEKILVRLLCCGWPSAAMLTAN